MIVEKIGKDGKKIYQYREPTKEDKQSYFGDFIEVFKDFAECSGIDSLTIELDFKLINEINIRVDKRKDYYIIYHDETYLSEVREAALTAYWILKFKPFLIKERNDENNAYDMDINCCFALYIILSSVGEYVHRASKGKKKFLISEQYMERIKYALKYWDLSKESMMLISETLCESILNAGEK